MFKRRTLALATRLLASRLRLAAGAGSAPHGGMARPDFKLATDTSCVFDADLRFVYFTHNKNAQTSVNRVLLRNRAIVEKDNYKLWTLARAMQLGLWERRRPVTFTIVRNPFDRVVSAFCYLQKIGKIAPQANFEDFMTETFVHTGPSFDPHFLPQAKYHLPIHEMGFDHVIYFEDLAIAWPALATEIGAPPNLPHSNRSRGGSDSAPLHTATTLKIIRDVYAADFDQLAYDPSAAG